MAHIIIIDDEDLVRATFRDLLEDMGYAVTEAVDGDRGLKALEAHPAEMVITDLLMPNKEGIETILELRKKKPNVKIIAVSGGGSTRRSNFLDMAKKLGADKVFAKPVDLNELADAVQTLIGDYESDAMGTTDS